MDKLNKNKYCKTNHAFIKKKRFYENKNIDCDEENLNNVRNARLPNKYYYEFNMITTQQ